MVVQGAVPRGAEGERGGATDTPAGPGPLAAPGRSVEDLLERMRRGDRGAAAEFFERYGSRVRRRLRGKLSRSMRRVFDSQDLMSTLSRRLDAFVGACRLEAATAAQLWSLVFGMAEHALADKGRVMRRLGAADQEDSDLAQVLLARLRAAEGRRDEGADLELEAVFNLLNDTTDKAILSLWLAGTPHSTTAECVDLSAAAVRQRWQSIRKRLRRGLEDAAC